MEGARELALRSRGTPRIANRLLRRVRDFAQVRHQGDITATIALEALRLFEVDDEGLDRVDREILNLILHKFDGGPVGLSTLAVAIGEEADTIEDVYEPFLLQRGFLMRTPRGRVLTRLGYEHCGVHASGGRCRSRGPAPFSGEARSRARVDEAAAPYLLRSLRDCHHPVLDGARAWRSPASSSTRTSIPSRVAPPGHRRRARWPR